MEATRIDVNVTSLSNDGRRLQEPTGLIFASDHNSTNDFGFEASGVAHFRGSSIPTAEAVYNLTLESFVGKSGDEFVHSLQNAEDIGLQSTRSVSADTSRAVLDKDKVDVAENRLELTDDSPTGTKRWSLLAIVFGVGLVLVAMHVMKTRRGRMIERDQQREYVVHDDVSAFQ